MPDKTKKTISATQVAALFDASPYVTRWMLYHHFKDDLAIDPDENSRMKLGRLVQRALLEQAADDLVFAVERNDDDNYVRNGLVGCTRDADVICPDRGPGTLELKVVWDYATWMTTWGGGVPPRHIELQTQVQMMVGDGKTPFDWGVIAVCICGEMKYFHREPMKELWDDIAVRAEVFFADVAVSLEPDAFGIPEEDALIARLYPSADPEKEQDIDDVDLGEAARMYAWANAERLSADKTQKSNKVKLLDATEDFGVTHLPGADVYVKKSQGKASVVTLPAALKIRLDALGQEIAAAGGDASDIEEALAWEQVTRKASVRTTIDVKINAATDPDNVGGSSNIMAG